MWGVANKTVALILSTFSFFSQTPEPSLIVQTNYGQIEGVSSQTRSGRTMYEFLGIPYAVPPVGPLRFKPPVPWNETWEGVRDGTLDSPRCIQYHLIARSFSGSEDCLVLFVYTHKFQRVGEDPIPSDELKPVILYIHGGLFMQGSGSFYKPKFLLDEDIVFVSLQYRVGALGFLNLETDDVSGNLGLKDQTQAMIWVKENIHYFGGDPSLVTIMGESAGSVSVHLHMLSPMSRGLFHRAISQSGTALVSWGVRDNPVEQGKHFAEKLGCLNDSFENMTSCLRELDANTIGRGHMEAATILHHRYALFGPTIESRPNPTTPKFLPDKPHTIIKSGNFSKVPWICGANSEEGLLYAAPMVRNATAKREINNNWSLWMPITFRFVDEPNKEEIADKIREYYFGNTSVEINESNLPTLITFVTDRSFFEGMHHTLNLHKGQHPIYPYLYSYQGQFSFGRIMLGMTFNVPVALDFLLSQGKRWIKTKVLRKSEINYGVTHGDELPLIFSLPLSDVKEKHPDYEMSKLLIKVWTTFAKDGVPPLINGEVWQSLSNDDDDNTIPNSGNPEPMKLLKIGKTFETVNEPFFERAEFWKSLNIYPERDYY